ncbi:MAG: M48 family metalloprotease [Acidobacteria bacterium]|nr:M48 family metalloprotease [Acidobacteriota bacterium]
MKIIILLSLGILSAGIVFLANWIALIPWRRAKGKHWSERARLYHPVGVASASNMLTMPVVFALAGEVFWPDFSPHWLLIGALSGAGAFFGGLPLGREVFPRIGFRDLLRQSATIFFIAHMGRLGFLAAAALMPWQFDYRVVFISGAVALIWGCSALGGWRMIGQMTGLLQPAPERLQRIVSNVSTKTGIPYKQVWLLRISIANAFVVLETRTLFFTERMLELLSDNEIGAICAHELGHLLESFSDRCKRYIRVLVFLPWMYFKPIVNAYGYPGLYGLLGLSILVPFIYRHISRRLEKRADEIARANEQEEGTYACALLKLHEDILLPAVLKRNQASHPHLYDRLLAAGITPDFPRPAAARSMAWHGVLFALLLGMLISALAGQWIYGS